MLRINLNLSIRRAALESPGLFRAHTPDVPLPQMVVNLMGVTRGVTAVPSTKSKAVSRPNDPLVSDEASVLCVVADSSSSTLMSLCKRDKGHVITSVTIDSLRVWKPDNHGTTSQDHVVFLPLLC